MVDVPLKLFLKSTTVKKFWTDEQMGRQAGREKILMLYKLIPQFFFTSRLLNITQFEIKPNMIL